MGYSSRHYFVLALAFAIIVLVAANP
jgi:hypothetical protein